MSDEGPFGPVINGTMVVVFYEYRPSKPAGFAFMALFALATLGHLIYLFRLRAWYFIPFLMGGIAEMFGYYGRALGSDTPDIVGPWIMQNLLILAGAPMLAATIYMSVGRVIMALDARRFTLISPRWLTKLYVLIDIGAVATQLIGSTIPASGDPSAIELSKKVILGGLIAQLVALSFFIMQCVIVHRGIRQHPPNVVLSLPSVNWAVHFWAAEVVIVLTIVRSVVRAVEYLQGEDGFVISHEVFIYVFDAFLMWSVMLLFLIIHPGRLIRDARRSGKEPGGRDEHIPLGSRG
ncbi:putative RTA1 domain protein [Truncatella angustata]|uniref:RTA1 domain protein n=1 Tax=Truncatella angustata TaxID=152316 RepID=A0A9P9A1D6_9PEZI|nr:putative RTA1 domain protein [Truncatella angustata]KAH6656900.1 putative RTA1 domain protein [Truncatella angustata]